MKQFASIKKRRKNTFGHGIRSRWPEPSGAVLTAPVDFIQDPPFPDPVKQAAYIERGMKYATNYGGLWLRLNGSEDVDATNLPERYRVGYPDQCFQTLLSHIIDQLGSSYGPALPGIGGDPDAIDGVDAPGGTITDVQPEYTSDQFQTAVLAPDTTPTTWAYQYGAGLCSVTVVVPSITYTYDTVLGYTLTSVQPSRNYIADASPWLAGKLLSVDAMIIQLLLWGKCSAPDNLCQNNVQTFGFSIPTSGADYLAYLEACAGRFLWQMAMVETLSMLADVENQGKGGRAGLVQGGSSMVKVLAPAATLPPGPVANPVLSTVNKVLEDAAVEIVLTVIELLL